MLTKTLAQLGGVATVWQLRNRGFTGSQFAAAVRLGEIQRIRRGWYGLPAISRDQFIAVRVGGVLAGISAAKSYGFWSGIEQQTHIMLPKNAARLRTNMLPSMRNTSKTHFSADKHSNPITLHWRGLNPEIVDAESETSWRVDPITAVLQALAWADAETAVACAESAIKRLKIDAEQIWAQRNLAGLSGSELHRVRVLLDSTSMGSDSGLESVFRQRVEPLGLYPVQQKFFEDVGLVDFFFEDHQVVVETDGLAFHSDLATVKNDKRRDRLLNRQGIRVIRFTYQQVIHDWTTVLDKLSEIFFNNDKTLWSTSTPLSG